MTLAMLTWVQESGHPAGDAAFLAALARSGWRDMKAREELRLRGLYGNEHMKAVGLQLRALGFDLVPHREPVRMWNRGS